MLHTPALFTFKTRAQDCRPPQEEDKDEVKVSLALGSPSSEEACHQIRATVTIHHGNFSRHQVSVGLCTQERERENRKSPSMPTGLPQRQEGCAIPHPLQYCHETGQDSSRVTRAQATHACAETALVRSHRAVYKVGSAAFCHWHAGLADLSESFA